MESADPHSKEIVGLPPGEPLGTPGREYAGSRAMQKADSLFAAGDYFAAAIEYERCFFLSDDAIQRTMANLAKVSAHKQLGRFEQARTDLQRSLPFAGADTLRFRVLYELAFCSYMAGDHSGALSYVQQTRYFFPGQADRLRLIEALALVRLERWNDLHEALDSWYGAFGETSEPPGDDAVAVASNYGTKPALLAEIKKMTSPDALPVQRDPGRARMMSTLLPGLGHVYAGEPGKGLLNASSQLVSVGITGILAWNGFYIAGITIGLGMFQSFYFGGIRQAGELAAASGQTRMEELKRQLAERLIALERLLPEPPGIPVPSHKQ